MTTTGTSSGSSTELSSWHCSQAGGLSPLDCFLHSNRQNAVIADPAADEQFPPGLCIVTIPSQGFEMDAFFYLASAPQRQLAVIALSVLNYFLNGGDFISLASGTGTQLEPIWNARTPRPLVNRLLHRL
jgi:hypothetical protein